MERLDRRALLVAASCSAGALLAGCGVPPVVRAALGRRTHLGVHLIGFPHDVVTGLAARLQLCADAYVKARRGLIDVQVSDALVPESDWFMDCTTPTATCPASDPPATAAPPVSSLLQMGSVLQGAQLWNDDGRTGYAVRGRTRLGVRFGTGAVAPPLGAGPPGIDIVIAYDLWQHWLAPLALDATVQWKTTVGDRDGLSSRTERYGTFFSLEHGSSLCAFPLLRNPMLIGGMDLLGTVDSAQGWTWDALASRVAARGAGADISGFAANDLHPEATECACAMVAAYGGSLGTAGAASCSPAFAQSPALAAIGVLASLVANRPPDDGQGVTVAVQPRYLWDVLWSNDNGRPCWSCTGKMAPLPAGPQGAASPCSYVCASVLAASAQPGPAMDFCSFLMTATAQDILLAWDGGLALRGDQAMKQLLARPSYGALSLPEQVVDPAHDLVAEDLFGGAETADNWGPCAAVADAFAGATKVAEEPPFAAANVSQIIHQASDAVA